MMAIIKNEAGEKIGEVAIKSGAAPQVIFFQERHYQHQGTEVPSGNPVYRPMKPQGPTQPR